MSRLLIEEGVALDLALSRRGERREYDDRSYVVHENDFVETVQWSILKKLVVEDHTLAPGRFWRAVYEQGTERFDSVEDGKVAFTEVFPQQRIVTEFFDERELEKRG